MLKLMKLFIHLALPLAALCTQLCDSEGEYSGPQSMTVQDVKQVWFDINGASSNADCTSIITVALGEGCKYDSASPEETTCEQDEPNAGGSGATGPWQVTPSAFANEQYRVGLPSTCGEGTPPYTEEMKNPCCTAYVANQMLEVTCLANPTPPWA
ncbi:hypothetical protein ScalyP_jg8754 [Parmales sp. scaly parma]|nr:hypothetical protein ScalyP_jg8754 [Parmales sp. scaly parma]